MPPPATLSRLTKKDSRLSKISKQSFPVNPIVHVCWFIFIMPSRFEKAIGFNTTSGQKMEEKSANSPKNNASSPPRSCVMVPGAVFAHLSDAAVIHSLAFVGGYIDAAGYLKIKGVFTSSITGNLVVACASVSSLKGVICRACVCIAFTAAGCVSSLISMKLRLAYGIQQRHLAIILFSIEIAMFIIIWIVGDNLDSMITGTDNLDAWPVVLIGSLMGASMGFHNVAAKETITNCPPTTVMTSTLINVAGGIANGLGLACASCCCRLTPPNGPNNSYLPLTESDRSNLSTLRDESFTKLMPLLKPLIWFLVGAIIGAATMSAGSFHSLAIPLFIIVAITVEICWKDVMERSKASSTVEERPSMNDALLPVYQLYMQGTTLLVKKVPPSPNPSPPVSAI